MDLPKTSLTLDADGVAALLGWTKDHFFARRRALEAEHGFPPALPGMQKWSRPAIRRWIATNGRTFLPADLEIVRTGSAAPEISIVSDFDRGAV